MSDDKGLQAAFQFSNVAEEPTKAFLTYHGMQTLEDYIYSVTSEKWETELKALLQQVPQTKDNAILLARFRAAYTAGKAALTHSVLPSVKATEVDEPLPDSTYKALQADWEKRYLFKMEPWLELRARIYREFKKGQMSVLEMKKVRSVIAMAAPKVQESVTISDNVQLEFHKDSMVPIKSAGDYYFQLRTLAHAWAWSGNFQVSWEGKPEIFIDLGTAVGYADHALHSCLEHGAGSLTWLQRNDVSGGESLLGRPSLKPCVRAIWSGVHLCPTSLAYHARLPPQSGKRPMSPVRSNLVGASRLIPSRPYQWSKAGRNCAKPTTMSGAV